MGRGSHTWCQSEHLTLEARRCVAARHTDKVPCMSSWKHMAAVHQHDHSAGTSKHSECLGGANLLVITLFMAQFCFAHIGVCVCVCACVRACVCVCVCQCVCCTLYYRIG